MREMIQQYSQKFFVQTSSQIFLDDGFYTQISVVTEVGQTEIGSVDLYMKNNTDSWLIEQGLPPQVNYSGFVQ